MVIGVGPVHALPSTCLEKVEEQPEDADNQRNVTRMGSQPSDLSTAVHIPVTLTGPPGETTVVPSEYLPSAARQGPLVWAHFVLLLPLLLRSGHWGQSLPLNALSWRVLAVGICASASLCLPGPRGALSLLPVT